MVTGFSTVLMGFEWCKLGFTLSQVALGTILSCLMLIDYAILDSQLGASSGLSYTALSRSIFGRWGSRMITINLILIFFAWYGLAALMLAGILKDLFHWQISTRLLPVTMAILMSVNNFFGFKGVANFARYIASPMLIAWIFYSFYKATAFLLPQRYRA